MTDIPFGRSLRRIDLPVDPPESFAHSLLALLETELAGDGVDAREQRGSALSPDELEGQAAEELPLREAMSVIDPSLGATATGGVVGFLGEADDPGDTSRTT